MRISCDPPAGTNPTLGVTTISASSSALICFFIFSLLDILFSKTVKQGYQGWKGAQIQSTRHSALYLLSLPSASKSVLQLTLPYVPYVK